MARDEKRIKKAELSTNRRQTSILQKQKQRQQSMEAADDMTEYGPGLFH